MHICLLVGGSGVAAREGVGLSFGNLHLYCGRIAIYRHTWGFVFLFNSISCATLRHVYTIFLFVLMLV